MVDSFSQYNTDFENNEPVMLHQNRTNQSELLKIQHFLQLRIKKVEDISESMGRLTSEELKNVIKRTVIEDILEIGRQFASEMAQDTIVQAYRRLIEDERHRKEEMIDCDNSASNISIGGGSDLQSLLSTSRQSIVNKIKMQHVPDQLISRVRSTKDQSAELSQTVQRILSDA